LWKIIGLLFEKFTHLSIVSSEKVQGSWWAKKSRLIAPLLQAGNVFFKGPAGFVLRRKQRTINWQI
jgi:hypothetical protein